MKLPYPNVRGAVKMYFLQLERPGVRENLKYWMTNFLLLVGCLWTFLLLSGCKEPKAIAVKSAASTEVNKDQMNAYLNDSDKKMSTPEIMHTAEPTDTLKDTPPINPQMNTSF